MLPHSPILKSVSTVCLLRGHFACKIIPSRRHLLLWHHKASQGHPIHQIFCREEKKKSSLPKLRRLGLKPRGCASTTAEATVPQHQTFNHQGRIACLRIPVFLCQPSPVTPQWGRAYQGKMESGDNVTEGNLLRIDGWMAKRNSCPGLRCLQNAVLNFVKLNYKVCFWIYHLCQFLYWISWISCVSFFSPQACEVRVVRCDVRLALPRKTKRRLFLLCACQGLAETEPSYTQTSLQDRQEWFNLVLMASGRR